MANRPLRFALMNGDIRQLKSTSPSPSSGLDPAGLAGTLMYSIRSSIDDIDSVVDGLLILGAMKEDPKLKENDNFHRRLGMLKQEISETYRKRQKTFDTSGKGGYGNLPQ